MPADPPDRPSFEQALARLESIVEAMEEGQVPLTELLAQYEEGMKLLQVCEGQLKDAELKIEVLAKARDRVALEPFASDPAASG